MRLKVVDRGEESMKKKNRYSGGGIAGKYGQNLRREIRNKRVLLFLEEKARAILI